MSLNSFITQYEPIIRMSAFFCIFAIMALWEILAPRRQLTTSKRVRWGSNIGLVFLNTFLLRMAFPAAAVGVALLSQERTWGLFNVVDVPFWLAILASVIIMDFVIWLQHVMVHAIPLLWRLHRMHHADLDFDVTTGSRFHPIEIFLSMGIKFATIVLLGPPVVAVVIFEVLLNATAMFNHANVRLPLAVDRVLRAFIVTPDMHRVHHSIEEDETNSNFGFNLSIWDRLFGTYKAQPRGGHEGMTIGIRTMRDTKRCAWLPGMLAIPFIGKVNDYAINRRNWEGVDD
jgi:sterol desaturase/sphingolipid hydroxylase (fatty acid hydroxylase superfamily)